MMNRRPAPPHAPRVRTHGPPIVVAIRITVSQLSGEPVEVVVHQDTSVDDTMWRPEATARDAPTGTGHPYADVELTAENLVAAVDRRRPAPTGTTATSRRIRRNTVVAGALVIAAILAGVAIMRPTPRHAFTEAPPPVSSTGAIPAAARPQGFVPGSERAPTVTRRRNPTLAELMTGIPAYECRHLLIAAALTARADPAAWIVSLTDGGGRLGRTLDQAVRRRLVAARTALRRAERSPAGTVSARRELDSVIAEARRAPCSPTIGWPWICPPWICAP